MLGDSLDTENVVASYEAGVLRLEIPVAEAAKPRKIAVRSVEPDTSDIGTSGQSAVTSPAEQDAVTA